MEDGTVTVGDLQTESLCDRIGEVAFGVASEPERWAHLDLAGRVAALVHIGDAIKAIQSIKGSLERAVLASLGETKEAVVAGVTVTKRQARASEVWDNTAIVGLVVQQAVADRQPDTDGVVEAPQQAAVRALDNIYGLTSKKTTRPRTAALKTLLGLDDTQLDDFRSFDGWKPPTVQISK